MVHTESDFGLESRTNPETDAIEINAGDGWKTIPLSAGDFSDLHDSVESWLERSLTPQEESDFRECCGERAIPVD